MTIACQTGAYHLFLQSVPASRAAKYVRPFVQSLLHVRYLEISLYYGQWRPAVRLNVAPCHRVLHLAPLRVSSRSSSLSRCSTAFHFACLIDLSAAFSRRAVGYPDVIVAMRPKEDVKMCSPVASEGRHLADVTNRTDRQYCIY
jgi:hypothetical protein